MREGGMRGAVGTVLGGGSRRSGSTGKWRRVWRPECVCGGLRTRPELADRETPVFRGDGEWVENEGL